jgi:ATP-dependent Lon protease
VITGLAYSTLGGATLHVEATVVPSGRSGFKQTGQLGDVMRESSEIAYSFVRSLFSEDGAAKELFANNIIHLHVPAGATPKDGPSAGITMACALYSLVTGSKPAKKLAMTGELTLSGLVMPIGGVKEKVIAARRSGVKTLILPHGNRADFEDLEDHIVKGLTVHFVERLDEVLGVCFPSDARFGSKAAR